MNFTMLNVVLIDPEIPQNTGNIGRTCVGVGATLHLVGKVSFLMDDRSLKRAGLDYWPRLRLQQHESWEAFSATLPAEADVSLFSTKGKVSFWEKAYRAPAYLVFGSESRGFPKRFYTDYEKQLVRIPVSDQIRSLNVATAVGIALFEAIRQIQLYNPGHE